MSKTAKRIWSGVAAALIALTVIGFVAGNYFYELALDPHQSKSDIFEAHMDEGDETSLEEAPQGLDDRQLDIWEDQQAEGDAWFMGADRQDLTMESSDGLQLHATQILHEPAADEWVVICHGYISDSWQMTYAAKRFYEMGYNVLLPDARGHGRSEGDYIGLGWDDRLDVIGWTDYIVSEDPDAQIVLYGVSMGGAAVMMASGEELPPNVKAIIEDCGYSSIWDEMAYQLDVVFGLPAFPLLPFTSLVTRLRAGFWLTDGDAVAQVAKSDVPMLFIHGENDEFVPFYMMDEVYDAAGVPKEKLAVAGAEHGTSALIAGELYWDTISRFLHQYVN